MKIEIIEPLKRLDFIAETTEEGKILEKMNKELALIFGKNYRLACSGQTYKTGISNGLDVLHYSVFTEDELPKKD